MSIVSVDLATDWGVLNGPLCELDLGAIPSPSGAGALVLHAEEGGDCLVVFMALQPSDRQRKAAIATFVGCTQSIFGYPNDEAYSGVPGASYGFFEVVDSNWAERVAVFNRIRFPATERHGDSRHFFMGCHDASGQFLADDVRVEVFDDEYAIVLHEALRRLLGDMPD